MSEILTNSRPMAVLHAQISIGTPSYSQDVCGWKYLVLRLDRRYVLRSRMNIKVQSSLGKTASLVKSGS